MDFFCESIPFYATTIASLLLTIILLKFTGSERRKKHHPIAGTIFHNLFNFSSLHHYHTLLASKYRNFRMIGPMRNEIYITEPANVEYILKTNFHNYGKGWFHYNILKGLLGDGIFAVDGEMWKQQRKLASYDFSTKVMKDFSSVVFRSNAAKLGLLVAEAATTDQTLEIQDLFMKSTLDSVFKVAFGIDLDSLNGASEEAFRFCKAFDEANAQIFYRYVDVFWGIKRFLKIGSEAKLIENIKVIDDFVYKLIHAKMHQMSSNQMDMKEKKDLVSRFLASSVNGQHMNASYLRDIILNIMIAGKDTTAVTLSWFFYILCKNPVIQEKVSQEVDEVIRPQSEASMDEIVASLDEEALNKMQYLHAVMTETLRLYPGVAADGKQCLSDDTLPDGFQVRKGDLVAYLPYAMGRMKFIWGQDAEEFKPERWIDELGNFKPESPFKFTAFQAGPRICLGKEFAYMQMKIFAAVLLHYFNFKLSDEQKEVKYRTMLTLHIEEGLYIQASNRKTL